MSRQHQFLPLYFLKHHSKLTLHNILESDRIPSNQYYISKFRFHIFARVPDQYVMIFYGGNSIKFASTIFHLILSYLLLYLKGYNFFLRHSNTNVHFSKFNSVLLVFFSLRFYADENYFSDAEQKIRHRVYL